jgi:hypothetical protein
VFAAARGPGSPAFRRLLAALAALYLAGIWLDAAGVPLDEIVPRPILYFMQVARLFPHALPMTTEFRAEATTCGSDEFHELDVRPFFPVRANDKENRFERALFFYRNQRLVMHALDRYLVDSVNRTGAGPIAAVRFMSLRIPIPPPGHVTERYRRQPIADYPPSYRKYWYETPAKMRRERCERIEGVGVAPTTRKDLGTQSP